MNLERIKLSDIDNFKNHPYKVENDESLEELKESIKTSGLLNPIIVRPKENGRYEMISGHRRKLAIELLGEKEVNATVKELSDDEATILMVDSNISRERILPSEKAKAYKMKYDAMKSMTPSVSNKRKDEILGEQVGESREQIRRYIRLNNLIPELLQLVDDTVLKDKRSALTMGLRPAVELSYLSKDDQELVYEEITYEDLTPSHVQAKKIRELGEKGELDFGTKT